jgi:hypothetical protein
MAISAKYENGVAAKMRQRQQRGSRNEMKWHQMKRVCESENINNRK